MAIDADVQSFIDESDSFYPADTATRPVAEQRRLYDAYARAFAVARPAGVGSEDQALTLPDRSVPLRLYRPAGAPKATLVYAHGGGYLLGSLDSHDGIVARLAGGAHVAAIAVDYRLVPEHPGTGALDDVQAVIEAVAAGRSPWNDLPTGPLILAGDSAGASLVASAAVRLAGAVPLAGMALVYPALGAEPAEPARTTEAEAPMLTLADVHFYRELFLGGRTPDPWTFPLDATSFAGLPPTLLVSAEHDPLRDDCTAFAARLAAAGIRCRHERGAGLVHGFLRAIDRSAAARDAFAVLVAFVAAAADDRPGFGE